MCFGAILLSRVSRLVYAYEDVMGGGTGIPLATLAPLYRERKMEIVPNVLREQSIKLFKAFFSNPDNAYWRNSRLSQYTLDI
jgi:tRNA(adenine34) deaminase